MKKLNKFNDDDYKLCKETLPKGLIGFIRNKVLPEDNTLIHRRGGKKGICFQCGSEIKPEKGNRFRQGYRHTCPSCGKELWASLYDGESVRSHCIANVAAFQKGEDNTLFIRFWHVLRGETPAFSRDSLWEYQRFAIKDGACAKWLKESKESMYYIGCRWSDRYQLKEWKRSNSLSVIYDDMYYLYVPENWEAFTKGTCLQYCDLPGYMRRESPRAFPVHYATYYARFAAFEKLEKAGYSNIVGSKICRDSDLKRVSWTEDDLYKALRLPKRIVKTKAPSEWMPHMLSRYINAFELVKKKLITEAEAVELAESELDISCIKEALKYTTVHKVIYYLETQCKSRNRNLEYIEGTYRDYLNDCVRLNYNMAQKSVLFPKNLRRAHERTIELVKYAENAAIMQRFKESAEKLECLAYENDEYIIRPARSEKELIKEGQNNHHCVAGYATRMAEGRTAIFFIRRKSSPERTYFTLEYRGGDVIQCRTKYNRSYITEPEVQTFVEEWLKVIRKRRRNQHNG